MFEKENRMRIITILVMFFSVQSIFAIDTLEDLEIAVLLNSCVEISNNYFEIKSYDLSVARKNLADFITNSKDDMEDLQYQISVITTTNNYQKSTVEKKINDIMTTIKQLEDKITVSEQDLDDFKMYNEKTIYIMESFNQKTNNYLFFQDIIELKEYIWNMKLVINKDIYSIREQYEIANIYGIDIATEAMTLTSVNVISKLGSDYILPLGSALALIRLSKENKKIKERAETTAANNKKMEHEILDRTQPLFQLEENLDRVIELVYSLNQK